MYSDDPVFNPATAIIEDVLAKLDHAPPLDSNRRSVHSEWVRDLGDGRILKYGRASLAEAQAMRFVRDNTNIPVPKVLAVFKSKGVDHIVMERIDGDRLDNLELANSLSSQQLRNILEEIHQFTDQLTALPEYVEMSGFFSRASQPPSRFGNWGNVASGLGVIRHLRVPKHLDRIHRMHTSNNLTFRAKRRCAKRANTNRR
ncbi:hypothetical protein OF83DRAFT_118015 [Amylostereum chailletii]|nr:hypothetical protein OF83DRAFT_118015 [Amylostereum chailletii]